MESDVYSALYGEDGNAGPSSQQHHDAPNYGTDERQAEQSTAGTCHTLVQPVQSVMAPAPSRLLPLSQGQYLASESLRKCIAAVLHCASLQMLWVCKTDHIC